MDDVFWRVLRSRLDTEQDVEVVRGWCKSLVCERVCLLEDSLGRNERLEAAMSKIRGLCDC